MQNLWKYVLAVDVVIVVLHLWLAPSDWFFNLDHEWNLPTFWQGEKLVVMGVLALGLAWREWGGFLRWWFGPMGLGLLFVGLDELLMIHENAWQLFVWLDIWHPDRLVPKTITAGYRSSLWMIYYLPLMVLAAGWFGYWVRHFASAHIRVYRRLVGVVFVGLVVVMAEVLGSSGMFEPTAYYWLMTVEEAAEMVGATMVLAAMGAFERKELRVRGAEARV